MPTEASDAESHVPPTLRRVRALIVEDRESDQAEALAALRAACDDCNVELFHIVATTYEQAYRVIATQFFDIILLDLVLHAGMPGDSESWEGLWLLQDIAELGLQSQVAVAVLSSFGDVDVANLTLSKFSVLRFWDKSHGSARLARQLTELFREQHCFGLGVSISIGLRSFDALIADLGKGQFAESPFPLSQGEAAEELEHLIRKLYSSAVRIDLRPVYGGRSGAGLLRIERYSSTSRLASVIAKYGSSSLVRQERDRFHLLSEYIEDHRSTQVTNVSLGRYLGVLQYTLIGSSPDEIEQFEEHYQGSTSGQIVSLVTQLFSESCSLWYAAGNRQPVFRDALPAQYMTDLGYTVESIEQAYTFKFGEFPHENWINFIDVPRRLPHPVAALRTGSVPVVGETWNNPTHGDLRGDNLLVSRSTGQAWMVDFGASGYGHWARDFAALECSIKFGCLQARSLQALYQVEDALASTDDLSHEPRRYDLSGEESKALDVLLSIRRQAAAMANTDNLAGLMDYYCSLYFQTLNYLRFHERLKSKIRKNQILMSAGVALDKLSILSL